MKSAKLQFKIKSFYFLVACPVVKSGGFILLGVVFSFSFLVFNFSVAQAAQLFFEPQTQEIKPGDYFQLDLFLDTQLKEDKSSFRPIANTREGEEDKSFFPFAGAREIEEINAIEGKIVFPSDLLAIKEILDGDSIINFWTEKPSVSRETGAEIIFSGIIPGGFKGVLSPYYQGYKPGKILSLIFKARGTNAEQDAKLTQNGLIEIQNPVVLLNDGLGTPARVSALTFQFKISQEAAHIAGLLPISDPDPPEPFEPIIAQDPNVFDGKWFLVFNAQDKGSGIDYYAVRETRRKTERQTDAKWIETESPFLLKDQKLRSYIYVKAIDKAGNERIAMLSPQNPLSWYENSLFWVIIIVGIIFSYFIRILWKKQIAKLSQNDTRN